MKLIFLALFIILPNISFAEEINFSGVIRNTAPCIINNGEELQVFFGAVNTNDLYANKNIFRTFNIQLSSCDDLAEQSYSIQFSGIENENLKGSLSFDTDNGQAGAAIKLSHNNRSIDINTDYTELTLLDNGDHQIIKFDAFIVGEPDAIQNENIQLGDFVATATFNIFYQ